MSTPRRPGAVRTTAVASLVLLGLALATHACGNDKEEMGPGEQVSELEFAGLPGDSISLSVGGTQTILVEALGSRGNEIEDATITVSSSDTTVATVSGGQRREESSRIALATTEFTIRAIGAGRAVITFREAASGTIKNLTVTVTTPAPGNVTIMVGNGNFTFSPKNMTIARGTQIVWSWNDTFPHSTTSDTGVWDSGIRQGPGPEFTFTFNEAGSFPYFCRVHGAPGGVGQSGTITVMP